MIRPSAEQIANFFDEIDEIYLTPFDWNPNEKLPSHGRTYRLKDRFKIKFKGMVCAYEELEDCRIAFHCIFKDNIKYVYQCQDIIEKIKKITNPEKYEAQSQSRNTGYRTEKTNSLTGNSSGNVSYVDDKDGSITGAGEAITSHRGYNEKVRAIETKGILDKSEDAIMQIIDPNARQINQTYKRSKNYVGTIANSTNSSTSDGLSGFKNEMTNISKVEASNELRALVASVPRLTSEFLECFNALFYY